MNLTQRSRIIQDTEKNTSKKKYYVVPRYLRIHPGFGLNDRISVTKICELVIELILSRGCQKSDFTLRAKIKNGGQIFAKIGSNTQVVPCDDFG